MTEPRHRRPVAFLRQLVLLTVCGLLVPAQLYLAIPLASPVQASFGASGNTVAWTGSAFSLAYAIGFLVFGPLSDRVGRRRTISLGLLGLTVTTLALSLAPTLEVFLALRAVQGLTAATFAPVALVWVTEQAPPARRGWYLSLLTTGLLGAGLAGQAYGSALLLVVDWRITLAIAAVAYLTLTALVELLLDPGASGRQVSLVTVYRPVGRLMTRLPVVAVFVAAPSVFGSFVGLYGALNSHLAETQGLEPGGVLAFQALGCLGLLAAPLLQRYTRRPLQPRTQALAGFALAAAAVTAARLDGMWFVPIAASVVYVAGLSLVVPALVGLLAQHAPQERAAAVGLNTFLLFVGAALAPFALAELGYDATLRAIAATLALAAGALAVGIPLLAPSPSPVPVRERLAARITPDAT